MASRERLCAAAAAVDYGGSGNADRDWGRCLRIEVGACGECCGVGCDWSGGED